MRLIFSASHTDAKPPPSGLMRGAPAWGDDACCFSARGGDATLPLPEIRKLCLPDAHQGSLVLLGGHR